MEKFLQFLSPLKLPTDVVIGTIFISTLFFTFCPNTILERLSLLDFINQFKFKVSLFLVISSSYLLVIIINSLRKRLNRYLDFRRCSKNLLRTFNNLSLRQRTILADLYLNNLNSNFNMTDPDIIYLARCKIINVIPNLEVCDSGIPKCKCMLSVTVKEFLNRNKKFIIENQTR